MKKNMGTLDRGIRILVAILIAGLYFTNLISGTIAIILSILAVIFVLTSFAGLCPLYFPFGISTRKKKKVIGMSNLIVLLHSKPKH